MLSTDRTIWIAKNICVTRMIWESLNTESHKAMQKTYDAENNPEVLDDMDKTLINWLTLSQVVFKCVHGNPGNVIWKSCFLRAACVSVNN